MTKRDDIDVVIRANEDLSGATLNTMVREP